PSPLTTFTLFPYTTLFRSAAISSFVLEHLEPTSARAMLSEVHRVLRPGGVLVSLLDLDCSHPVLEMIRKISPDAHRKAFIEVPRSEEHTSELQSRVELVCR